MVQCVPWCAYSEILHTSVNVLTFVGVNLKILKCEKSCPGVPLLVDWLKGAFDALEKKYVSKLYLRLEDNLYQES